MLYALCGVSGVGKTTLQHALLQREPTLRRFVTSTTRAPRPGEINHIDYHFLSVQQFESAVRTGRIVCPIQYREAWYGTAREDLEACAQNDLLAVLRPDKITELQMFTTLIGIYILKAGQDQLVSPDDQLILDHRHLCLRQVTNIPGDLDAAVTEILALIHTYSGGSLV
jgi:guanylate kinase